VGSKRSVMIRHSLAILLPLLGPELQAWPQLLDRPRDVLGHERIPCCGLLKTRSAASPAALRRCRWRPQVAPQPRDSARFGASSTPHGAHRPIAIQRSSNRGPSSPACAATRAVSPSRFRSEMFQGQTS
jgi:hypothetical protein